MGSYENIIYSMNFRKSKHWLDFLINLIPPRNDHNFTNHSSSITYNFCRTKISGNSSQFYTINISLNITYVLCSLKVEKNNDFQSLRL